MDLKELRNFMHVARAGSVSRASKELRLAQPALSRQIQKLEHELGVSLFTRHGRGMRLSSAGSLLLERADAIAELVQTTRREIRADRTRAGGRFAVGVPPAAGRLILPSFVTAFQQRWPAVTLLMREGVASSLLEWVVEKRIAIAMIHNPPHLETLEITPLLTERMWVIGPRATGGNASRARTSYRIGDLAELPLILPNTAHTNRRLVEQAAAEHGVRLRIDIEVDSVAFAKTLVENGLGYTILTYAAVQDEVERGALTAVPIARPALSSRVSMVSLRGAGAQPLTHDAGQLFQDICRTLVRGKGWAGAQLA
jgi:LysR family nitrogen assimilation transcriptional regulator